MKVVIVGMGMSGSAAGKLCDAMGYEWVGIDADKTKGLPEYSYIPNADLYVLSPGISPKHTQIMHATMQNVPWIGEAEFALRHIKHTVLGITGTNGKTTVTSLIAHILTESGVPALACGNIGKALSEAAVENDTSLLLVAELSSFQLETIACKKLSHAAIINISPDHLDRYTSFEEYAYAKCKIKEAIVDGGTLFIPQEIYVKWKGSLGGARVVFPKNLDVAEAAIGKQNISFAYAITKKYGISDDQFFSAVSTYKKLPHRIEFVATAHGIDFYDDSKGTNVAAAKYAIDTFSKKIVLIAGGLGKGEAFLPLLENGADKIKAIVAIGAVKQQIIEELSDFCAVHPAETMQEAVSVAFEKAEENEVVLLSPACASFDMFQNYKHRGEVFRESIQSLHLDYKKAKLHIEDLHV